MDFIILRGYFYLRLDCYFCQFKEIYIKVKSLFEIEAKLFIYLKIYLIHNDKEKFLENYMM